MRRVRFIDGTGRRMTCTVEKVRMPWEGVGTRLRWAARRRRRAASGPRVYDFDPGTLDMRDTEMERRMRRGERSDRFFAKVANALNSMIEMQKHIG